MHRHADTLTDTDTNKGTLSCQTQRHNITDIQKQTQTQTQIHTESVSFSSHHRGLEQKPEFGRDNSAAQPKSAKYFKIQNISNLNYVQKNESEDEFHTSWNYGNIQIQNADRTQANSDTSRQQK